jgi:hypothetical protein
VAISIGAPGHAPAPVPSRPAPVKPKPKTAAKQSKADAKQAAAKAKAKRAAARRQAQTAKRVTSTVAALLGLKGPRVDPGRDGTTVTVAIPAATACGARDDAARTLRRRVRELDSSVAHVTLRVVGASGSLATYLAQNCHPPAGSGTTIYTRQGSGLEDVRITVPSKRWTLSYVSYGAFLEIVIGKGARLLPATMRLTGPGSGQRTLPGPGRFQLHVAGASRWALRVQRAARK